MMKKLSVMLTLALGIAAVAPCVRAAPESGPTVGDLVMSVARLRHLPATTPQEAWAALARSDANRATLDLSARLTERDVVRVSAAVGLEVTTRDPGAVVDASRLQRFLSVLGPEIGDSGSEPRASSDGTPGPFPRPNDHAADPLSKGKGKKKGIPRSPSDPS